MRADKFVCGLVLAFVPLVAMAQNFSGDPELVAAAEKARIRSAVFWTGKPLPNWKSPCPVDWSPDRESSVTSFTFRNGRAEQFQMMLADRRDILTTDTIPHEVDHAVRATIIGHPIPRWLDEGCAAQFESARSRELARNQLIYAPSQYSVWDMLHLKEYPASTEETDALYNGSALVIEWMLEARGPKAVLQAQEYSLDSDSKWQQYVGESKQQSKQRFEQWFAAKYSDAVRGSQTTPDLTRPHVDVNIAGDFPCKPCESFLEHARQTRVGRPFDYHVYRVSLRDCQEQGISVPAFSVNGKPFESPFTDWSDIDAWGAEMLGLTSPPTESVADSEPLAMGHPYHPQQYRRPQQPQQQTPLPGGPLIQQQAQQSQIPAGVTASPEALAILAQAMDNAPKPKEPDPEINWKDVTVVVAASNDFPEVAKAIEGPAKRTLQRLTKGHAILRIVSERTNPDQFANYESTLGLNIDKLHVSVLIPETSQSLPIDFLIQQIEIKLHAAIENFAGDKLKDIPVEPILERLDSEKYTAVWDTAFEADSTRDTSREGLIGVVMGLIGLLVGPKLAGGTHSRLLGWAIGRVRKHVDTPPADEPVADDPAATPTRKRTTRKGK
jgi:hypothetical protein